MWKSVYNEWKISGSYLTNTITLLQPTRFVYARKNIHVTPHIINCRILKNCTIIISNPYIGPRISIKMWFLVQINLYCTSSGSRNRDKNWFEGEEVKIIFQDWGLYDPISLKTTLINFIDLILIHTKWACMNSWKTTPCDACFTKFWPNSHGDQSWSLHRSWFSFRIGHSLNFAELRISGGITTKS